jgi:hypothetical protein
MARRICAGNPPAADVLADALAIRPTVAYAWLTNNTSQQPEIYVTEELLQLALQGHLGKTTPSSPTAWPPPGP